MLEHKDPYQFYATTILSVRKNGEVSIAGDGQVSLGHSIMKSNAKKNSQNWQWQNNCWICWSNSRCLHII